jgi:short-subunit dehydrogenase
MTNLLQGKYGVVLGAGGSIGAAVAKEFAVEGAEVFLAGRTKANVEAVTKQITANAIRSQEGWDLCRPQARLNLQSPWDLSSGAATSSLHIPQGKQPDASRPEAIR